MPSSHSVEIESPSGIGSLSRKDSEESTAVEYSLQVRQKMITVLPSAPPVASGVKEITGMVQAIDNPRFIRVGETFTLHLEDGRKLNVIIKDGGTIGTPGGGFY